jgi:hypothetical protein
MQMSAKFVSMMMLLLLPALTEAQQVAKCPQPGPLSEAQLAGLVKGSVPAPRIGQFVAVCGIDFEPTEDAVGRLRSAGAPESVLAAVGERERGWEADLPRRATSERHADR